MLKPVRLNASMAVRRRGSTADYAVCMADKSSVK